MISSGLVQDDITGDIELVTNTVSEGFYSKAVSGKQKDRGVTNWIVGNRAWSEEDVGHKTQNIL